MQSLSFGEQMPSTGGGNYLRVKGKGDQIKFRIGQPPVYTGKHFATVTGEDGRSTWDVTSCPRINNNEECPTCEKFFALKAEAKKAKDAGDAKASDKLNNDARSYQVAVQFYFPVLNRDTQEFGILQTTQGVRNKINEHHESGVNVLEKDWVLRNTGSASPKDLYSIVAMDSKDTAPLTPKEDEEYLKAVAFDLNSINEGGNTSDEGLE